MVSVGRTVNVLLTYRFCCWLCEWANETGSLSEPVSFSLAADALLGPIELTICQLPVILSSFVHSCLRNKSFTQCFSNANCQYELGHLCQKMQAKVLSFWGLCSTPDPRFRREGGGFAPLTPTRSSVPGPSWGLSPQTPSVPLFSLLEVATLLERLLWGCLFVSRRVSPQRPGRRVLLCLWFSLLFYCVFVPGLTWYISYAYGMI